MHSTCRPACVQCILLVIPFKASLSEIHKLYICLQIYCTHHYNLFFLYFNHRYKRTLFCYLKFKNNGSKIVYNLFYEYFVSNLFYEFFIERVFSFFLFSFTFTFDQYYITFVFLFVFFIYVKIFVYSRSKL